MHEKNFVGQSNRLAQIQKNFYQEIERSPASVAHAQVEPANASVDSEVLPAVTASLKTLLANELQIRESDIDEDVEFVDLGLDSISGVTWLRKIKEKYETSIEASKGYSYPPLTRLSRYVKEEAQKQGRLSSQGALARGAMPVVSGKSPVSRIMMAPKLASWRGRGAWRLT